MNRIPRMIIFTILLSGALFLSPLFNVSAQTTTSAIDTLALIQQLQELVQSLQKQILELKSKLETTQEELAVVKSEIQFNSFLSRGSTGDEVTQLQEVLKQDQEVYPEGLVTGYFGPATEAAIRRFQQKHGIEPLGIVGPRTRAKLNELITEGVGKSRQVPPGLFIAQRISVTTTAATTTPSGKVIICHYPPGNPENKQTIEIDQSAISAHLAHGDTTGACGIPPAPSPTPPPSTATTTPPSPPPSPSTSTTTATTTPTTSSPPLSPPPPSPSPTPSLTPPPPPSSTSVTTTTTATTTTSTSPPPPAASVTVDLKVNGVDAPKGVPYNSIITATWTSTGADFCAQHGHLIPLQNGGTWGNGATIAANGSISLYAKHQNFGYENIPVLQLNINCYTYAAGGSSNSLAEDIVYVYLEPPSSSSSTLTNLPDLVVVKAFLYTLPEPVGTGQEFGMQFWVKNQGTVVSGATTAKMENTSAETSGSTGQTMATFNVPSLNPGAESGPYSTSFVIQATGRYDFVARVDPDNLISETVENNNTASKTYQVSGPAATVTVIAPNGGENWQQGTTQIIRWSFSTISSDIDDPGPHATKILLQTVNGTARTTVLEIASGILTAQYHGEKQYNWTVPSGYAGDNYRIAVEVDPRSTFSSTLKVLFSDESNQNFSISAPSSVSLSGEKSFAVVAGSLSQILDTLQKLLLGLKP